MGAGFCRGQLPNKCDDKASNTAEWETAVDPVSEPAIDPTFLEEATAFEDASSSSDLRKFQPSSEKLFERWAKKECALAMNTSHNIEWLNFIFEEIWPFFCKALEAYIKETLEPQLQESLPTALQAAFIKTISLGSVRPKLGPLHAFRSSKQELRGVELDLAIDWLSDGILDIEVPLVGSIGIENFSLSGMLSIVLRPLQEKFPVIAATQVFMVSPPRIHWELNSSGFAIIAKYPSVASSLRHLIIAAFNESFVLPHRMVFPHWEDDGYSEIPYDLSVIANPLPEGVLRIGVIAGRDLHGKHWGMGGFTPTACAIVAVGAQTHETPTRVSVMPDWGDDGWFDFLLYNTRQVVCIDVFNQDLLPSNPTLLGRVMDATVYDLLRKPDHWWPLTLRKHQSLRGHNVEEEDLAVAGTESVPLGAGELASSPSYREEVLGQGADALRTLANDYAHPADQAMPKDLPEVKVADVHGNKAVEKVTGWVHIKVEPFNLANDVRLLKRPPPMKGSARSKCVLKVNVKKLRGLPRHLADGQVKIRIFFGEEEAETLGSTFQEPLIHEQDGSKVDIRLQRVLEFMATEQKLSPEEIANISGLQEETVKRVITKKPSFTAVWEEAFHFLVPEVETSEVRMDLVWIPHHVVLAEIRKPIKLAKLVSKPDMLDDKTHDLVKLERTEDSRVSPMSWKGMKKMLRVEKDLENNLPEGPFDLHCQAQLWGLTP